MVPVARIKYGILELADVAFQRVECLVYDAAASASATANARCQ